MKSEQRTTLNI